MPLGMVEASRSTTSGAAGGNSAANVPAAAASSATRHNVSSSSSAPTTPVSSVYPTLTTAPPQPHAAERFPSSPTCCHDRFYGPHTSTIRMNPYVRCVHDSGVPEIRSLKELLALKVQPEPAEPDTPCLRPSHGPSSTWQQPATFGTRAGGADAPSGARHADAHASSPLLAFTADSVATPNTFATVVTHERRIISHLTRRLRNSVRRHQDMPLGEPMEMVLSEGDEEFEEEEAEEEQEEEEEETEVEAQHGGPREVDLGEVPLLPCSTREKAAEAAAAVASAGQRARSPESHSIANSSSSSSSGAISGAGLSSHTERSSARPCSPARAADEEQRWLQQANNERIVSPHSSSGMLCEFPAARAACAVQPLRPPPHAHSATELHALHTPPPAPSARTARGHSAHPPTQHQQQQQQAVAIRSYPAPVAKLEESPYHYIMRNYIGGTFLYYSTAESKDYFLRLCHRVVAQVRPILEQETLSPSHGLFPRLNAPAYVFGDIHGNFEDLSFFLKRLLIFHDFNLTPANILCLGDYVDRGPFSLECVMLLFSLKIMNASKIVMLRGNHEDRVVCGDLQTYGRGCFLGQCQTVFGYSEGMKLFREVTALFKYLPLAAELVIPSTPNIAFLRAQQTVMHPNLYVSQPAVLLHDADAAKGGSSVGSGGHDGATALPARLPHPGGEVASGGSIDELLAKSTTSLTPTPTHVHTPLTAAAVASSDTAAYSTIADASLTRGQPSRHEAHEERILCTHGGIPRFDRPPLEENALSSLRSLAFPRMLTLFPNNPMVKDDPECAPDFFARRELQTLWRRYPSMAPAEFTAASRREAAEAAAHATHGAAAASAPLPVSSVKARKLSQGASSVGGRAAEERRDSVGEHGRSDSLSSLASSVASSAALNGTAASGREAPQSDARLMRRSHSREFLPVPTDEDVRKGWYTMFDLLWSDPTPMEMEDEAAAAGAVTASSSSSLSVAKPRMLINEWGFGVNTRGSNVVSFSAKAVDTFLTAHHYSMLFRAHQEKAHGLRWSKSNKVLTIFSSSNYMGHRNGAGCVVVAANGEVQMVEKVCL